MPQTAPVPMELDAPLALQHALHAWENDPLTPEKAQGLEQLLGRAIQLAEALQSAWLLCTRDGTVWDTAYYAARMRFIGALAGIVRDILTRASEILDRLEAQHPDWATPRVAAEAQPSLDAAGKILAESQRLIELLCRPRPPVNEEMIQRSQESLNRGEGEAVSDMIARLESGGSLVKE